MSTTIVIDEDVKVWIAARLVAQEKPEFGLADVGTQAHQLFRVDSKKLERFMQERCVANTAGSGDKHFNYLFRLPSGKYRLFRQGDPIEFSHAMSPTTPEVHRVPTEYKSLFAAHAKFPKELRPADPPAADSEARVAKAAPKHALARKHAPAPAGHAPGWSPAPGRGLRGDLSGLDEHAPTSLARRAIHDMLFLELGQVGSQLDAHDKQSFTVNADPYHGILRTRENLLVRMPHGTAVGHLADIVLEVDSPGPARTLFLDIIESSSAADDLKAHAFDALHLKKDGKGRYGVLVFLRTPNGILQEQAESVAYGYDFFFGIDANQVKDTNKFYALKAQILQWLHGKAKPASV